MKHGVLMAFLSEFCNHGVHQSTSQPTPLSAGSDREQSNHRRVWGIVRQTATGSRRKHKTEESLRGDLDNKPALRVVELRSSPLGHAGDRYAIS